MKIVVLETSAASGAVGLADEENFLEEFELAAARRRARDLIPGLKDLLGRRNWRPAELDLVIVCRGPGSYTGLRVGVMAAKTLAFALGTPLVAIDSLEVLAAAAPAAERILPVVDAQKEMIYTALFSRSAGAVAPIRLQPTHIESGAEWCARLLPGDVATGPALERFLDRLPAGCTAAPVEQRQPNLKVLWRLGLAAYQNGIREDADALEPLYLRPSSAEINWNERSATKKAE